MTVSNAFTFSGSLLVGKTVCIDTKNRTVENDGVNALKNFTGTFPKIYPGNNTVKYTDAVGSRTIKITVIKQDRKM